MEIIKILDSDILIKLVVISNKNIKKGEILQLNKNIILNTLNKLLVVYIIIYLTQIINNDL